MADITYIPIRQLYPHPDNPRKELGDLSELAASIKENGVYQNLTVIPGHYLNSREYIAKCVDEGGDAAAAAAAALRRRNLRREPPKPPCARAEAADEQPACVL